MCERLLTRTVVRVPIVTIVPADVELTIVIAVHVHRITIGIERPVLYNTIHCFYEAHLTKISVVATDRVCAYMRQYRTGSFLIMVNCRHVR